MQNERNIKFGRRNSSSVINAVRAPEHKEAFIDRFTLNSHTHLTHMNSQVMEAPVATNENIVSLVNHYANLKPHHPVLDTHLSQNKERIYNSLMEKIDVKNLSSIPAEEVRFQIIDMVNEIITKDRLSLSESEEELISSQIIDDMLGCGPLEPLLRDETVTDIMVNSPTQVFAERKGKLELTGVKFLDNNHVTQIARRIVSRAGRRVDESSPMCDARLADGSRVNVAMPPSVLKGTTICIRKFAKKKITLDDMVAMGNISQGMCDLLKICAAIRLNIIISGGTGSGKTTLLNAISKSISNDERLITIEDTAELQLQQQHVVTMETRDSNLEGDGEIAVRDLLKNSLRMRPDRIILGEVRGPEAFDLLQAMNTGHEGSMGTLHANSPRDALTRVENMISMGGVNLSPKGIRTQIANSVNLIVHINRMRDGKRRVSHITEITGMEGDVIITNDIFNFEYSHEDASGALVGNFKSCHGRPSFSSKASHYNLEDKLTEALKF